MALNILLVEDDKTLRYLITDALSLMDARVTECATADDALRILQNTENSETIELLLTDIRTPGVLDGYDLAKIVWEKWPHLPVILMSGHRLISPEQLPSHSSFMPKPYTLDQLFEAVGKHMGKPLHLGQQSPDTSKLAGHGTHVVPAISKKGYLSQL